MVFKGAATGGMGDMNLCYRAVSSGEGLYSSYDQAVAKCGAALGHPGGLVPPVVTCVVSGNTDRKYACTGNGSALAGTIQHTQPPARTSRMSRALLAGER